MSSPRRHLDAYYTPVGATAELLNHISVKDTWVLECCNGAGDITRMLLPEAAVIKTNDIDPNLEADFHLDASEPRNWGGGWPTGAHWVISNPPFNKAPQIIPLAYDYASIGIAMLLRLSYLEPCFTRKSNRAQWLSEHPPTKLIVLPRISFTGDGKTDNVTCAWMVWIKGETRQEIKVIPR